MTTTAARQTFRCELVRPPMTPNGQRRSRHWGPVRAAKMHAQAAVALGARVAKVHPVAGPVSVCVTWHAPDARRRDPDSLSVFLKAALDQLVTQGVLVDDSSAYVLRTTTAIVLDREDPHIEITLTEGDA